MGHGTVLTVILAVALLGAPIAAQAQPAPRVPRIGLLDSGSLAGRASLWEAFRQGMRELGYVEGRTVTFEARSADGNLDRLAGFAAELVRLKVDVMVVGASSAARAARQATAAIPIVMASGNPQEGGYVASLARPGGNVTGVTSLSMSLSAKRLELARELVPGVSRVVLLTHVFEDYFPRPGGVTDLMVQETRAAAQALGIRADAVGVRAPGELDGAFALIARGARAVLLVFPSGPTFGERQRLAELALKHRLPAVYDAREYVEAGGLIAYGPNRLELFRRAAVYVDKILKGAKPADLPVEQPIKFELTINLKTAKALGLTIPPSVLARAEVIPQ
jgi:putative ABC transport system substrate-binding protein